MDKLLRRKCLTFANHPRSGQKNDDRRRPYVGVLTGERQGSVLAVYPKRSDGVGSLIAGVKKVTRGIDVKTAGIVPPSPFLAGERQRSGRTNGEPRDAVVQTIGCIQESSVRGDRSEERRVGKECRY